jgi:hypothetical protein
VGRAYTVEVSSRRRLRGAVSVALLLSDYDITTLLTTYCVYGTRFARHYKPRRSMDSLTSWSGLDPRPHPEERARRRGAADSNGQARVSKDEDERPHSPSCFETHRSGVSEWRQLRSCRAATLLSMRARAHERSREKQPARVVECGPIVSALLLPMKIPTQACGASPRLWHAPSRPRAVSAASP